MNKIALSIENLTKTYLNNKNNESSTKALDNLHIDI